MDPSRTEAAKAWGQAFAAGPSPRKQGADPMMLWSVFEPPKAPAVVPVESAPVLRRAAGS